MVARFCLLSAGAFFLIGLLAGAWKYAHIATRADARAPVYVDIAHRASLMYGFACALIGQLSVGSAWSERTNFIAAIVLVAFFAVTIFGYVVHGLLQDTENQLERPHKLGKRQIPAAAMLVFMGALMVGEIGAFATILSGYAMR